MKKILLLTAGALLLQAAPVFAEPHKGGKMEDKFEMHDTNGDGVITEAEFLEHAKKRFVEQDTNGDGSITKEEAEAKKASMKDKWKEKRESSKEKRGDKREEMLGDKSVDIAPE